MGLKRRKNENIVNKCILRQIRGGIPFSAQFPRSYLQPNSHLTQVCIPLCDIQKDNAFASGHVLLGFTKCGEYLMSYIEEEQDDQTFGYTYTLHWWRFNLRKPLQKACHVSLFAGEVITGHLLLSVSHTGNDNRIRVHGYAYLGRDEQCTQCYVTVCPSPPRRSPPTSPDDTWVVHMKYNLLQPFPHFQPQKQNKLEDTILLNSVDSILAITVCPCVKHKTSVDNKNVHCKKLSVNHATDISANRSGGVSNTMEKSAEKMPVSSIEVKKIMEKSKVSQGMNNVCTQDTGTAEANMLSKCNVIQVSDEVDAKSLSTCSYSKHSDPASCCCISNTLTKTSLYNCGHSEGISNLINNNQETAIDIEDAKCSGIENNKLEELRETPMQVSNTCHQLSSFCFKSFSNIPASEIVENNSTVIDAASYLDIQVTTVSNTPYKLVECVQEQNEMKDHTSPCIHTRIVSLDVERYIIEALNSSPELKGKYWLLKNYSTLIVDVCESSQCVIMHIDILISVQNNNGTLTKRKLCSSSLLFTWNIASGETHTLDISPLTIATGKTEEQIFKEGCKKLAKLQKKYYVPSGLSAVQAFSNHNVVLAGKTLKFIKHPFQPIAIVL